MSKALADRAEKNLTGLGITYGNTLGGHCAGYARENIWQVYGADSEFASPAGLDAIAQFDWYERKGLAVPVKGGSIIGDLLYKFGGAHGHVGIRIPNSRVAENSSVHGVGDQDARGIRTIAQFGEVEGIVRLPEPNSIVPEVKEPTRGLFLGVRLVDEVPVVKGETMIPVRKWAHWMGNQKVDYNPNRTPVVTINGNPLFAVQMIHGDAYAPVRDLVALDKTLTVAYNPKKEAVTVSRVSGK